MLRMHHPELETVWEDLERLAKTKPVKPRKAQQPEGLKVTLLPFQQESLYWMREQEKGEWKGGCLADEMVRICERSLLQKEMALILNA